MGIIEELEASKNVKGLIEALKDKDRYVRSDAARVLGDIGDSRAVGPLIQALEDESWDVRRRVAKALGEIKDARAVEPLIEALKDGEKGVRERAAWALEMIAWQPKDDVEKTYYLNAKATTEQPAKPVDPATAPVTKGGIKMGIFDKFFIKKRNISPVTEDAYVNSCFDFDFKEEKEKRHYYKMKDLNEIFYRDLNGLINIPEKATVSVEKAINKYPDFDVLYIWLGTCYSKRELNNQEKAREICLEGLRKCHRKSYLCGKLGMLEFESNNLPEAVKWWIRSCVVQSASGQYLDGFSFLNLATIAKYLGLNKCYSVLFEQSKKIQSIIFDAIGESERASIVREQGNNSIKQAITLICKNIYNIP